MDDDNNENPEMGKESLTEVEEEAEEIRAKDIYVLMQKGCRVSRNIRASWYFKNIRSKVQFKLPLELPIGGYELSLVSLIPSVNTPLIPDKTYNVCVEPHTLVTFLASIYRLAFILDISPSVISVDLDKNQVLYDDLLCTLNNCIRGLVKPFQIPGSSFIFKPELYVTVMVQTPIIQSKRNQVLVQGVQITEDNVEEVLLSVKEKLKIFEQSLCLASRTVLTLPDIKFENKEDDDIIILTKNELIMTPEAGLVNMLRYGILSLQLLPENSCAGIIVITDGLVGLPDANLFESLLTQIRNSTISCSFLKIGSNQPDLGQYGLGHVPHVELMQFLATATFGAYIASCPKVDKSSSLQPNIYHKALYFWNFQKGLEGFKYELTHHGDEGVPFSLAWINQKLYSRPLDGKKIGLDNVRKKHLENIVLASIDSVISLRLREGYTIKEVQIINGGNTIEVKMVFPWREYVRIEYVARSVWPLDNNVHKTNVEVIIEGSYAFLHEITCQKLTIRSHYRSANVKRFWQTITSVSQTDKLLAHLQSFSTNTNFYKIPESIRNGIPLFMVSTSAATLNTQLNLKDSVLTNFASFWRPIVMLDTNIWQKWMHCHRIGLVLEHDMPLPKYLHIPNSSGRFHPIGCMQALTSLNSALREWCTFVLKENISYIKFQDEGSPPSYFCVLRVIRISLKGPCMVLRLAFLGGTPSSVRKREVDALLVKLQGLKFPHRGTQKAEKKSPTKDSNVPKKIRRKSPLMRDWPEINCCSLLIKPVEKILVRYDRVPRDMMIVDDPAKDEFNVSVTPQMSKSTLSAGSMFRMLSHYLCHQRWIWTIQQSSNVQVGMAFIGKVLQTLTKLRLQEGFHFAAAESGVVNLVLEVDMTDPDNYDSEEGNKEYDNCCKCVVQYVIFPPHSKTTRDSVSESDVEEMETAEADGEIQIVTECWTEPQYGVCVNNTPERKHFDGLKADQIAHAFFPVDYECISSLITYDHLVYLCENKIAVPNLVPEELDRTGTSSSNGLTSSGSPLKKSTYISDGRKDDSEPQTIPFPFDLLSLLPWSQQAELLFSTFIMDNTGRIKDPNIKKAPNNILFEFLMEDLADQHDREVPLSDEECTKFLEILQKRERDLTLHPLPFKYGRFVPECQDEEDIDVLMDDCEGYESPMTPDRQEERETKAPSFDRISSKIESEAASSLPIPKWKCFAKASSSGILSMTFIPASFDDLLLLNDVEISQPDSPIPTAEKHQPKLHQQHDQISDHPEGSENIEDNISILETQSDHNTGHVSDHQSAEVEEEQVHKIPELKRLDSEDPSSVSSSKEEDVAEWINTTSIQPRDGPLVVPIYVYTCSEYYISFSLIHHMDFQLPEDEYEDMTFDVSDCSDKYGKCPISPRNRFTSLMETEDTPKEDKDESTNYKWGYMTLDAKQKESWSEATHEFKYLRRNVSRIFFSCFVKGVSNSLQKCLSVHQYDLDAAINNICEESLPLESDITSFLHSSCGHLQHLVNRARRAEAANKNDGVPRRPSVRFLGFDDDDSASDSTERTPLILQFPKTTINLSNLVGLDDTCEKIQGLNTIVTNKFLEITKRWFRPVPSNPDYFYYCPDNGILDFANRSEIRNVESPDSIDDPDDIELPEEIGLDIAGIEDFIDMEVKEIDEDGRSISIRTSSQSLDEEDEDEEEYFELNEAPEVSQLDDKPLFIHFTCTLKGRLDQYNVSARTLPLCIGEILRPLNEDIKEIDLSNLKFTFDINCLTLPADTEPNRKPSFLRMISNSSTGQTHIDVPEADMSVVSSDPGLKEGLGDPIGHLQRKQHIAMMVFKEEIEWLLNDEIVSALRQLYPINPDTLQYVTEHVRKYKKENKPGCDNYVVPLKFVFGSNQSLVRFTEEFERSSVPNPNYCLTKEGDFYFVILNRSHSINIQQAAEIAHALDNLSRDTGKTSKPERPIDLPQGFNKLEERSNSLPSLLLSKDITELTPLDQSSSGIPVEIDSDDDDDGEFRPRSRSEAKYLRRSASGIGEELASASQVVTNIQQGLPLFTAVVREPTPPHSILKKSSSFASFETSATPPPIIPSDQLSPLKPGFLTEKVRNRHFSAPSAPGPGTPQSRSSTLPQTPSWVSSRGSYNEDGYEGDSSDGELDDTNSVSDGGLMHPQLPNFWLILQIHPEKAEIFFHTRDSIGSEANEEAIRERGDRRTLLFHVKQNIHSICKKVNQYLLLKELNETRVCNSLLVGMGEEDNLWGDKRTSSNRSMVESTASENEDEESEDGKGKHYLAARLEFNPGHFSCECMWKTIFVLHPRLKEVNKRIGSASKGFLSLKGVLNKLSVSNRKKMFVIKETQTDNVFYMRLRELRNVPVVQTAMSGDMLEEEAKGQDIPIELMAVSMKLEESIASKSEYDTVSNFSGFSRMSSRIESVVELLVYGIEEVGTEIQHDLVKALHCKLDETVLDSLSLMLNRNPKCKLKAEDVQFIQDTPITQVLQLSIPPHTMMYLYALMYYLRQNLLQFLHTPNYDSNNTDYHFQDDNNDDSEAVKSQNAFLYIRPPAGGKGLVFISLSLVDSTGLPVKLLNCPYPSKMTNCTIQNEEEFEYLVNTVQHDPSPDSSRPGPTALIQFKIWDRFTTPPQLKQLTNKLMLAVKQALCDLIFEYNLLTAPICHIPRRHDDDSDILHSSAPSSPVSPKGNNKDRRHSIIDKRFSDSLALKPVIQSASPMKNLKSLMSSKNRFSTPPPQSSTMFEFPESGTPEMLVPSSREMSPASSGNRDVRLKYESGDRGNLHSVYPCILKPWVAFCSKLGAPSVNKFELSLLSKFSVNYVLREIMTILPTISSHQTYKLFKLVNKNDSILTGVPFFPCRSPVQSTEDSMETSLDAARQKPNLEKKGSGYFVIGRDIEQWHSIVVHDNIESQPNLSSKNISNQKFKPYVYVDQGSTEALYFHGEHDFIPRQNLLTIYIHHKQIMVATYNWGTDIFNSLEKHITKLVQWHNARIHLLDSILHQKMGLFQHQTFRDLPYTVEQNPFTQPTYEKEILLRNLAPPRDFQRRQTISKERGYSHIRDVMPQFDEIYKEESPHIPLHKNTKISTSKDSVYIHGVQTVEVRNMCLKEAEKFNTLSALHNSWLVKTPSSSAVNEDHLKLLKDSSRLLHYCATPILFSSQWRHKVVEKTNTHFKLDVQVASTPPTADLPKSRSRHSSGASVTSLKNKRSESQDGRRKPMTPQDSPEVRINTSQEEAWHVKLRDNFITEYMRYLQNLGFKTVKVQQSSRKRASEVPNTYNIYTGEETNLTSVCLQKTMRGGILLMDIGYREEYFCVKLFVFDYSQISVNINQQMRLLFVDECQRYKDLIHVHSFAHDFHLRCIQRYIAGEETIFHQGFHLTNFLTDFSQIYSYAPSFSRNCLQQENVMLSETHSINDQVFEYMIKQMKQYDMRVVKMKAVVDYDVEPDYCYVKNVDEYALLRHGKLVNSREKETDDYDVGLIITQEAVQSRTSLDTDRPILRLKYFVLLTRRQDCFPLKNLEKRFGVRPNSLLPTDCSTESNNDLIENETVQPVPVKKHIGVRQEIVDYLGYSNKHQAAIYELLSVEMKSAWNEIKEMVETSKSKCRRDLLWKRMLNNEEEQKKRRKTDLEENRDNMNLGKLSYDEFQELLKMVIRTPLSDEDVQLIPLSTMPVSWYRSLVPILMSKYSNHYRCFTSTDGQNQCVLITNANYLGMFIMLEITPKKADLSKVIQEPITEQDSALTSPNFSTISMHSHIEDFVNTCCFHLWSTIL